MWETGTDGDDGVYRLELNENGLTFKNVFTQDVLWSFTTSYVSPSLTSTKETTKVNPKRLWQYLEKTNSLRDVGFEDTPTTNDLYNSVPSIADCSAYPGFSPMTIAKRSFEKREILASMKGYSKIPVMNLNKFICVSECSNNGLEKIKGSSCHSKDHFSNITLSDKTIKFDCIRELIFTCAPSLGPFKKYLCGKKGECSAAVRNSIFTRPVCRSLYEKIASIRLPKKGFNNAVNLSNLIKFCSPWKSTKNAALCKGHKNQILGANYVYGTSIPKDRIAELLTFLLNKESSPGP